MPKIYKLIFKAESPVHIGYRQTGNLKTTRYYIMGRQIWGAITANLTKALFEKPKATDYKKVGEFVKKHIKTTYFYPAVKKDDKTKNIGEEFDDYVIFCPEYYEHGLKIGKFLKDEFERYFIKSYISTALEVTTRAAEEGSLHEFEYVNNKIYYEGNIYDIYWIGYLIVEESIKEVGIKIEKSDDNGIEVLYTDDEKDKRKVNLRNVINIIQVGGERNYGFGKLKLKEIKKSDDKLFNKYNVRKDSNNIILKPIKNEIDKIQLIAHLELKINDKNIKRFYGEVEALVGLEWGNDKDRRGVGQKIGEIKICLVSGSIVEINGEAKLSLGDFGILKFF